MGHAMGNTMASRPSGEFYRQEATRCRDLAENVNGLWSASPSEVEPVDLIDGVRR